MSNRPTIFSLAFCRRSQFHLDQYFRLVLSSVLYAQFLNKVSWRERLNHFEWNIFVDSDKTFHSANFTTLNAALSSYQKILPFALHSEVWSCVQIFHLFIRRIAKILAIFCSSFKLIALYSSLKNFCKLTVSKHPVFDTLPCKFLVQQNVWFVGLYCFGWRNEYPWTLPSIKTPKSLITLLSSSSIFSRMLQCKTYCFKNRQSWK